MTKVYYNPARRLTPFLLVLPVLNAGTGRTAAQQEASLKTSALESHEGMTISAQPCTNSAPYKEKFHKKSTYAAGIGAGAATATDDTAYTTKADLDVIALPD